VHYFVTGATGFIGRYVTSQLLAAGHDVTALVRTREQGIDLASFGVRPALGDVVDKGSMRRAMKGVDGVVHAAGWHRVGARHRHAAEAINVAGTRNVLELMWELRIPKGVYTSTVAVFGNTKGKIVDEQFRSTGRLPTIYARSKAQAHYEIAEPFMRRGLPLVVLMPGAVYGPDDTGPLGRAIGRFLVGRMPVAPTRTAYSWAHVLDVAWAHVLALETGRPGRTYIVGGEHATLLEVLRRVAAAVGRRREPFPVPGWSLRIPATLLSPLGYVAPPVRETVERLRATAGVTHLGDSSRARDELGWRPMGLDDGLPDAVRGLLQQRFEADSIV
jgi:nucleoside-diphosphate-sugar epimerase